MEPLRNFAKGVRGVIATEFALVAPIMVSIWVGIVELSTAHLVATKIEIAAQSAADIIAQEEFTTDAKLDDIVLAMNAIIAPYPIVGVVGYDMASVEADGNGTNSLGWHRSGGTLAGGAGPDPADADALTAVNDSVIVVSVSYLHRPVLFSWLVGDIALNETVFARPRRVPIIPLQ